MNLLVRKKLFILLFSCVSALFSHSWGEGKGIWDQSHIILVRFLLENIVVFPFVQSLLLSSISYFSFIVVDYIPVF